MVTDLYDRLCLTKQDLKLMYPPNNLYRTDLTLALHLTDSMLVETMEWDGDTAVGETAFWLKVLSAPSQTDYKLQKIRFKRQVYSLWSSKIRHKQTEKVQQSTCKCTDKTNLTDQGDMDSSSHVISTPLNAGALPPPNPLKKTTYKRPDQLQDLSRPRAPYNAAPAPTAHIPASVGAPHLFYPVKKVSYRRPDHRKSLYNIGTASYMAASSGYPTSNGLGHLQGEDSDEEREDLHDALNGESGLSAAEWASIEANIQSLPVMRSTSALILPPAPAPSLAMPADLLPRPPVISSPPIPTRPPLDLTVGGAGPEKMPPVVDLSIRKPEVETDQAKNDMSSMHSQNNRFTATSVTCSINSIMHNPSYVSAPTAAMGSLRTTRMRLNTTENVVRPFALAPDANAALPCNMSLRSGYISAPPGNVSMPAVLDARKKPNTSTQSNKVPSDNIGITRLKQPESSIEDQGIVRDSREHYKTQVAIRQTATAESLNALRIVPCIHCDFKAIHRRELDEHKFTKHDDIYVLPCPVQGCNNRVRQPWQLRRHMITRHSTKKNFKCDQCDYAAKTEAEVKKHIVSKHEKVTWNCELCDFKCDTNKMVIRHHHMAAAHEDFSKVHRCQYCSFFHVMRTTLIHHINAHHTRAIQFRCGIDDCKFSSLQEPITTLHQKTVHGVKPKYTKKKTAERKPSLTRKSYRIVHKYFCSECRQPYRFIQLMQKHIVSHHDGKAEAVPTHATSPGRMSHTCLECSLKCTDYDEVLAHIRTAHQGRGEAQSEYIKVDYTPSFIRCTVCDFECETWAGMKSHVRSSHEHKLYECDQCGLVSLSKNGMTTHKKFKHSKTGAKRKRSEKERRQYGSVIDSVASAADAAAVDLSPDTDDQHKSADSAEVTQHAIDVTASARGTLSNATDFTAVSTNGDSIKVENTVEL